MFSVREGQFGQITVLSVTRLLISFIQGSNDTFTYFSLKTPHKQQLVELISCDWVTPLQLSGQATSAWLFLVCALHCGKWGTEHLHSSPGALMTQPSPPLNPPLLVSWMRALLLSPPLFFHPEPIVWWLTMHGIQARLELFVSGGRRYLVDHPEKKPLCMRG